MKLLPYTVHCNQGSYWERIAAFDCEVAARRYAEQCALANKKFGYRTYSNRKLIAEWN